MVGLLNVHAFDYVLRGPCSQHIGQVSFPYVLRFPPARMTHEQNHQSHREYGFNKLLLFVCICCKII